MDNPRYRVTVTDEATGKTCTATIEGDKGDWRMSPDGRTPRLYRSLACAMVDVAVQVTQ